MPKRIHVPAVDLELSDEAGEAIDAGLALAEQVGAAARMIHAARAQGERMAPVLQRVRKAVAAVRRRRR